MFVWEIPMHGEKESLNVSVAFGIVAYGLTTLNHEMQFWLFLAFASTSGKYLNVSLRICFDIFSWSRLGYQK